VSRIGKVPVRIPSGVSCDLKGSQLTVTGPKGTLEKVLSPAIAIAVEGEEIVVTRPDDKPQHRALHGLTRALIQNMVTGVSEGYERRLIIEGVGYRASLQGNSLNLSLGYSHPVSVDPPEGITFAVEGTQTVKIAGISKELVGQTAADIRRLRPPEPYKGKGIRYDGERIRRKVGKAGAK
jgi:large subunit ribosomal protein L6